MSNIVVPWSASDEEKLAQLWAEGKSFGDIAKVFDCRRGRISGKIDRMGLMGSGKGSKPGGADRALAIRTARAARPAPRVGRPPKPRAFKPPPAPKRIRPQEVPPPEARMVSLMDLKPNDCKWPIGDPAKPGFGFCGAKQFGSFPYCQHHVAMAYVPVKARGSAPKMPALHSGVNGSWRQGVAA